MGDIDGPSRFFKAPAVATELDVDIELFHSSEGSYCVLYKCVRGGIVYVLKGLKRAYRGNALYEMLLLKEYELGIQLDNPGVCKTFAFEFVEGIGNAIRLEWIDGETLQQLVGRGGLDRDAVGKTICEICDALDYVHHKQIIHRDLKPSNIMIARNGGNVKLIDFGLADADYNAIDKSPAGTLGYAAPELVAGEAVDSRSDIYSLGRVIDFMTDRYRGVAARCMAEKPEARYQSAAKVKEAILDAGRRRRRWIYSLAAALLLAVGTFFLVRALRPGVQSERDIEYRILQDAKRDIQKAAR
jgi:serine/threonine protein kinase